ncbi:MAG: DUF421 domain-containing protein [Corynebacterium camporealensis]|uniref:DUF421 domain-containing protein n=2 Tax=Corynebacterium camporealensis TaxID=161896 RepID=UPI002A91809F|nr:YetF domain-containing protein [Corynebacterium camporealensis]MDY5839323.1 DUF421 domain-containing protein [Corynebacterium camporealensis]
MDTFMIFLRELAYQLGIDWHRIPVVVIATIGIYLAFMGLVKIFGSRVLSSMTASDAVIIIMFGAVAGRVIVGTPPTLAAGVIGLATLMILEATFGTIRRFTGVSRYLDRHPVLLIAHGKTIQRNVRYAHVSDSDINSAVRKAGLGRREDVQLLILEPTGHLSVIKAGQAVDPALFKDVHGAEHIAEAGK